MLVLVKIIDAYSLVVFAAVVVSWIQLPPDNPIMRVLNALTEPVLGPVRRALPEMGGFDLSPMIVLIALRLLRAALLRQ